MGQACSTSVDVQVSTPKEAVPAANETLHDKQTVPAGVQQVSTAGQLSSPAPAEQPVPKSSTDGSKVSFQAPSSASHNVGVIGIAPVKNTEKADSHNDSHNDTPSHVHNSETAKPYADDSSLQIPVTGETLDHDNSATAAGDNPEGQQRQHVIIAEPQEGSKRASASGAAANSESGQQRATYSVAGNTSVSEHSFLTDTAVGDAADLADEVSESVMKAAPSAAPSRMDVGMLPAASEDDAVETENSQAIVDGPEHAAHHHHHHPEVHGSGAEHHNPHSIHAADEAEHSQAAPVADHDSNSEVQSAEPVLDSIEATERRMSYERVTEALGDTVDAERSIGLVNGPQAAAGDDAAPAEPEADAPAEAEHSHGAIAADSALNALMGELSTAEKDGGSPADVVTGGTAVGAGAEALGGADEAVPASDADTYEGAGDAVQPVAAAEAEVAGLPPLPEAVAAPAEEVVVHAEEAAAPTEEAAAPAEDVVAPADEVVAPAEDAAAPAEEAAAPAEEAAA